MTAAAKLKVSLTLSADLVALVDRDARRGKGSRSGVIEQWLRRAANAKLDRIDLNLSGKGPRGHAAGKNTLFPSLDLRVDRHDPVPPRCRANAARAVAPR